MFGNHGLCGLLEEGAHEKSPKCLGGNLGDFGEFCKGLIRRFGYTVWRERCRVLRAIRRMRPPCHRKRRQPHPSRQSADKSIAARICRFCWRGICRKAGSRRVPVSGCADTAPARPPAVCPIVRRLRAETSRCRMRQRCRRTWRGRARAGFGGWGGLSQSIFQEKAEGRLKAQLQRS